MAYNKLSTYKTKIGNQSNTSAGWVRYHTTEIVVWTADFIILQCGDWKTATTKRKMNQASHQFGLGFSVWQKHHEWFVTKPNGETVAFEYGMSFSR